MAANFYVSQFIWLRFKEERKMNGKKSLLWKVFLRVERKRKCRKW